MGDIRLVASALLSVAFGIVATADDLPVVDISGETNRHVIVAAGTESVYQGHPTTLLAPDGKTIFCVWTINHGGGCGPMARSDDGGRTWTRIDDLLPAQYKFHRNCPTLQTVPRPDCSGVNFCVFSANKEKGTGDGLGILMSRDNGAHWYVTPPAPHLPSGMPPTGFMPLKDGTCALFGQVRKDSNVKTDRPTDDQAIWMSVTKDGGFTWSRPRIVAAADGKNLCEPFALRSPDGKEICLLMRENRHTSQSMMCFSRDEGKTWTEPVDTCWGLTGDRHEGVMLPDGRYVIAFRDRALESVTRGQYVAWVGTWDDIKNTRPGQYRIHLLKHYSSKEYGWSWFDTGYSGVELLPNGEIVCTTYVKYRPDEKKSSVVCTRFRIEETDRLAELMKSSHVRGKVSEAAKYEGMHSRFAKAFEFMWRPDLGDLKCGRYEIDGTNCWAVVSDISLKPFADENQYEAHRAFIDIHVPISGCETIGATKPEAKVFADFNVKDDYVLFKAKGEPWTLKPGEFAIFFPEKGAHAPGLSSDASRKIRKLVIKVRASRE